MLPVTAMQATGQAAAVRTNVTSAACTGSRLIRVSFRYLADRILLLLAYVSSLAPGATLTAVAPHGPAHGPQTNAHHNVGSRSHSTSHLPAPAPSEGAEHLQEGTMFPLPPVQSLPEAHEPRRARPLHEATKPGQHRALEHIAKEPPIKGWQVPLKKRKMREIRAAEQPPGGSGSAQDAQVVQAPGSPGTAATAAQAPDSALSDPLSPAMAKDPVASSTGTATDSSCYS